MHSDKTFANPVCRTIGACILAALCSVVPGLLLMVRGYTLVWRDTAKLFQPLRSMITDSLTSFHLPLWNPHEALGIPLFAQMMHGVVHPVSVLTAFLLPQSGLDLLILIHTALAAAGSTLLARCLGLSPWASAVAGISYGLSGYLLGMGSVIQYLYGASSAPWAIAGILAAGKGIRFGPVAASAGVAVLLLAGDPQWGIIAIIIGTALALEAGGKRGLARAVTGIAAGALIASVQLIPTMVFLHQTSRGVDLDIMDRIQWALSPWRLIEFISPGFFGSPGSGLERWPVFVWLGGYVRSGLEMPFVPSVYLGAATLLLAARGMLHSRTTRILAAAALVFLWMALGSNYGAEQIMHHIPVWGKFRYAEKMVGPLTLCVALLTAFGVELLSGRPSRTWAAVAGVSGGVSLAAALLLSLWHGFDGAITDPVAREAAPMALHNLEVGLTHAGLALAALALLMAAALKRRVRGSWFAMAASVLVFIQLAVASTFAMYGGLRKMNDDGYLQRIKSQSEPVRIATPLERNYLYPKGLNQFDAQIGMQSRLGVPCYNVSAGVDQFDTYTGLRPDRLEQLIESLSVRFGVNSAAALRRFAVTHMMIKDPYFPDELEVARVASEGGTKVLDDREWGFIGWSVPHRPWAFFAEKAVVAAGEKESLNALMAAISVNDPTVVVENSPLPKGLAAGKILSLERKGGMVRIVAESEGEGLLVVNDSFWPGWRATIDGKKVPILRADFLVRAVNWPTGRHKMVMRYEPEEVLIGWLLSGAGIVALFALLIVEWRKNTKNSLKRRKTFFATEKTDKCG